jgi:hypothetical protein
VYEAPSLDAFMKLGMEPGHHGTKRIPDIRNQNSNELRRSRKNDETNSMTSIRKGHQFPSFSRKPQITQ